MNLAHEVVYRARRLLLSIYGPAELDEEHDPTVQLDRSREGERREEDAAEAEGTQERGRGESGGNPASAG